MIEGKITTKCVRDHCKEVSDRPIIRRYWTHWVQFWPMQITRAADYAVRVMVHLACRPEGEKVPLAALARATAVSGSFLSKVLQRLVHNGMVSSHRGTGGGFCLKKPPAKTTLLEVIEAIEGPLELNVYLGSSPGCDRQGCCGTHSVWQQAQEALSDVLRRPTIGELARATARNLHAVEASPAKQGEDLVVEQVES